MTSKTVFLNRNKPKSLYLKCSCGKNWDFSDLKNLKSIFLPFPGEKNLFNFYIKWPHCWRCASSYEVKYLSNHLNDLNNGFYEDKIPEIHIFTIFRRQKIKICGIFFNFYIKWGHFLRRVASYAVKYLSNYLSDPEKGFYEEKKNWNSYIYHFQATKN